MKSGVRSMIRCCALLTALCGVAAAAPAMAPSSTQPSPKWVPSPLVNLPPNVESVTIPLRRAGDLLCAPVQIDGKEAGWFLIDTGTSASVLDESVAKRLGLEIDSSIESWSPSKTAPVDLVRYRDLRIGQVSMRDGFAGVADLSVIALHANFPCTGLLGCDLLRELPVTIDFRSAMLTFYRRQHFKPVGSSSFPLLIESERPSVEISIESWAVPIVIDTGATPALNIEDEYRHLFRISIRGRHVHPTVVADIRGVAGALEASFGPVKILGKEFQSVRATCPAPREQNVPTDAGWMGVALLQDARLTFDYKTNTVWADWRQKGQPVDQLIQELGGPKSVDLAGVTSLMRAVELGWDNVVSELIKRGADVNAKSAGDCTALIDAAEYRRPRIVKLLLSAGADPNMTTAWDNMSALYISGKNGDAESVKALLAAHAKIDIGTTSGETALTAAAGADYPEVVRLLLEGGADVNSAAKSELTAISSAAAFASPQIVELLLQHGARVNGINGVAQDPLMAAAASGNLENVKVLLEHGANANSHDPRGMTPLMIASSGARESVVLSLLEWGADTSPRSIEGKTAADYAKNPYIRSAILAAGNARTSRSGQ